MLKGFETRHVNITNNVLFETELPVDCSKVIKFAITAIFPTPDRFYHTSRVYVKISQFAQPNISPNTLWKVLC